ncbi:hypothetical protein GCM10023147_10770 [Tsukamurella soli]|uniref:DNA-binding transcriptional regulator of glucitol operon n=1 Tax=Tsukamurella soli TaxID=644556 RepID=A0ABP8J8N5_9ACTN
MILFVVIAAIVCLLMGWWQWDRYQSSSGTGQNLGYALQWPLFAVACIWGYRRFVQLEAEQAEEDAVLAAHADPETDHDAADVATPAPSAVADDAAVRRVAMRRAQAPLSEIPADFLPGRAAPSAPADPDRGDETQDDYNRMLAELAASDARQERQR